MADVASSPDTLVIEGEHVLVVPRHNLAGGQVVIDGKSLADAIAAWSGADEFAPTVLLDGTYRITIERVSNG